MRILLIEDEIVTARMIKRKLNAEGLEADWLEDGEQGISFVNYSHYDAIILDLGLPQRDGLSVLRWLRKQGIGIPVLIITSRVGLHDKIAAFENGADDYLGKPFSFFELLARLKALTRRFFGRWTDQLEYRGLTYRPNERQLSFRDKKVRLSKREGELLEILLREKGKIVTRDTLLNHIWGPGEAVPNNADTLVRLLRKKLRGLPPGIYIRTIRGLGYMLDTAEAAGKGRPGVKEGVG